jgi:ubiquinone/menaquinone biosynthesis C-methylase UbiE
MESVVAVLLEGVGGFMRSRVILTASELDLFTFLDRKPANAESTARNLGLNRKATARLLDCLVTLGLLEKKDRTYQTAVPGRLLSSDHPQTLLPMALHLKHQWDRWSHLTERVRQGGGSERSGLAEFSGEDQKNFIGAMHVAGRELAREIAGAYDTRSYKRLLDIGGGSGSYTAAFLERNPSLTAVIFDLEEVIQLAEERIRSEGLQERVELVGGDFYVDELPRGCDFALLSAIIHQNSPEENFQLFGKIRRVLQPGGVLLIRDYMMDESRTTPPGGALFALNMLVSTRSGDTYTLAEVTETLERAGFVEVKQVRRGARMDDLLEARVPN